MCCEHPSDFVPCGLGLGWMHIHTNMQRRINPQMWPLEYTTSCIYLSRYSLYLSALSEYRDLAYWHSTVTQSTVYLLPR